MNVYELSRNYWDWAFINPEKIKPIHTAILFFAIEHCNRLGWKERFGFPSQMTMEAIGVKSYNTYKKSLDELVEWNFIQMIERSKNQYSANIIALSKNNKAPDKANNKALDKAFTEHGTKQSKSTQQSNDSIDKQIHNTTNQQNNNSTNTQKDIRFNFLNSMLEYGFDKKLAKEWMSVRKTKKATNTETAFKKFITEVEKTSFDKNAILKLCIEKDWKGLNHSWIKEEDIISINENNNTDNEPTITFRDNVNPTKRKLPKSQFLELQEQGKAGGYIYQIISEE